MATANAVPTTAFHVTFIFCIIVLTMVFAHFLVRLCMLTLRDQPDWARQKSVFPTRFRHQDRPRDLETGLHQPAPLAKTASSYPEISDLEISRALRENTVAPPAYGWWRGSVRIDPEEMHRFHDPDQSELHQHTRSLVFAGSGQRPPSYSSDPLERAVEQPMPLFHRSSGETSGRRARNI